MQSGDRFLEDVRLIVENLFPKQRVVRLTPLVGGLVNTNLRVEFRNDRAVVVRIYRNGATTCQKEAALLELLRDVIPVPRLIHAEPEGVAPFGSFSVLQYVEGITFQELKRTGNLAAINEAAASVGTVLGEMGKIKFDKAGGLEISKRGDLEVGDAYTHTADPISEILERFVAEPILLKRAQPRLVDQLRKFVREWSRCMPSFQDDRQLVHNDFGNRNIVVREESGHWAVAAVLDWEFALSGSPLLDVGHFLRYEKRDTPLREPFFSHAFMQNGGYLPDDWRRIVRVIDLTGLVECLTHTDLPQNVETEIIELIQATLENRD